MTDTTWTSLPEDLAPLPTQRIGRLPLVGQLVLIASNHITVSPDAMAALGNPERAMILLGTTSRMLAFQPVSTGGIKFGAGMNARQFGHPGTIKALGLPPLPRGQSHRFEAQLVDGCLLIGPLPRAEDVDNAEREE